MQISQEDRIYTNYYKSIKAEKSKENYNSCLRSYMRDLSLWNEELDFPAQKYSKLIEMSKEEAMAN